MEIAKILYREDDYAMFEIQMALAENLEKCDEREQAEIVFNECFQQLDGRDGTNSVYSRGMSIGSKLSKALSIKSKGNSIVKYGQRTSMRSLKSGGAQNEANEEKAQALQRIAV